MTDVDTVVLILKLRTERAELLKKYGEPSPWGLIYKAKEYEQDRIRLSEINAILAALESKDTI
jgi:hypothetical protein